MLKDLTYITTNPDFICASIAKINGVDINGNIFERYEKGVYRHDGYLFNFDMFIEGRCAEKIIDKWVAYGVCDNYKQILEYHKDIISDNKNYVIGLSTVERKNQDENGGWRWHKWGEYIGNQNPQHEYLYDDTHIDKVYCYQIYEIE